MTFPELLRNARKSKGITQVELSKLAGLGRSTVAMYESGQREPNFEVLKELSKILDVTPEYLISGSSLVHNTGEMPSKYTWLHGLVEDVLQDEPAVLAVLESSAPYVAGSVGGAAKDVLRSSLRLVTDSMASYDASPGVLVRGGNEYTKNNFT